MVSMKNILVFFYNLSLSLITCKFSPMEIDPASSKSAKRIKTMQFDPTMRQETREMGDLMVESSSYSFFPSLFNYYFFF